MNECNAFYEVYSYLIKKNCTKILLLSNSIISDSAIKSFFENALTPILRKIWERILIVELNFADQDGLLIGKSSADRFDFFVREVCKPQNLAALCKKYPELWEKWLQELASYTDSLERVVGRIASDIELVSCHFYGDIAVSEISSIVAIGDPHNGMQQTVRVEYATIDGTSRIIYYKPRNLTIDEGFFEFIVWLNKNLAIKNFAPRVLNCGDYGWAEAISQQKCETVDQVRGYYRRYGSLIALTHIFAATDLHMENIVAFGEYPVIVDLETLFSCTLEADKQLSANYHLYASLLLPVYTAYNEIEVSPLSARAKTKTNIDILVNPQHRSSTLKMKREKLITGEFCSQVIFEGEFVDFNLYKEEIINGLRETLLFLSENKNLVFKSIENNMKNAQIRIVIKSTEEYTKILHNIYHPDSLRKCETARNIRALASSNHNGALLEAEMADLERGDVPYFQMRFDTPILTTGLGQKLSTPIYQSPQQKLKYQFTRLTPTFIEQSVKDVEHAFLIYSTRKGRKNLTRGATYEALSCISNDQWLDELARIVLDEIMARALFFEGNYSWRTISMTDKGAIHAVLSETDLYQGIVGVALAFHLVGRRLSCHSYLEFARTLSKQVRRDVDTTSTAELGALTGTAGTLWAMSVINTDWLSWHLSTLEQGLAKLALRLVTDTWEKYENLDFVTGAAGTLSMLLRLHSLYGDYPIAKNIKKLTDYTFTLIKNYNNILLNNNETLLGFAHGTAGVSSALAEYMTYFRLEDRVAIAIIMRNIERETYHRTDKGWLRLGHGDIREASWCHGTVGIGYSRIQCRPYIPAEIYDADIRIITERLGETQSSLCLCHGMIGDYYLARALGIKDVDILRSIRKETEIHGIRTNVGLNGFEMVGALNGVTSLFIGEAIFLNKL